MTSKKIQQYIDSGYDPNCPDQYKIGALWQIALQLALFNEHQARMEARYMEMTEPAVKNKKSVRQPTDRSQKPE